MMKHEMALAAGALGLAVAVTIATPSASLAAPTMDGAAGVKAIASNQIDGVVYRRGRYGRGYYGRGYGRSYYGRGYYGRGYYGRGYYGRGYGGYYGGYYPYTYAYPNYGWGW
ncbi:MAG: hypothetical protein FWD08_04045 [Alphaproteobacteria bacterium]|nr:hypothetical protein [Alphaproteobacteria bacterium]